VQVTSGLSGNATATEEDLIRYWDGIAVFLGVSVKTAQRYEQQFGLPVRRKKSAHGSVVYAFRSELRDWLRGTA
jgi:hypothetical protein